MEITLPHKFVPRSYQMPFLAAMRDGCKRACWVVHRRGGKDKTAVNFTSSAMFDRVGTYYHCLPTYNQGRKVIWDGRDKDGLKFTDHFPAKLRKSTNNTEMKIEMINGSIWQIVGADNYDAVVGANPIGIVFSEWAISDKYPDAWNYFRPMLAENGGWAVFIYTPRGRNHGFSLYQMALNNPDWFCQVLTVDDTGAISPADIEAERQAGMSPDMINQEFYCSFVASVENIVIPFDLIQSAVGRDVSYPQSTKLAGLDVARFGDDRTALVVRQGGQIIHVETWSQADSIRTAGRCIERYNARLFDAIAVDAIGVGAGVADILINAGVPTTAVNVAESPSLNDSRFSRLRDELWWKLREWFEDRACGISKGIMPATIRSLMADIQDIHYDYTPTGKIKVEGKPEMKKRLGFSPDLGDALCLTFAAERFARKPVKAYRRRETVGFVYGDDRPGAHDDWGKYKEIYV